VIVHSLGFLAQTLPFMIVGVIFAEFIIALNIVDKISFLAGPLTRFAHLSEECGASFMPLSYLLHLRMQYSPHFIVKVA